MGLSRRLGARELGFLGSTFIQTCTINSTFAIVAPFFPLYALEIGVPAAMVALVFGAFAVAQLAMAPFAGGLASGFGRKRVLTVGVTCVSVSTISMGLAAGVFDGDPEGMVRAMVVLRVIQGGGAAMATTCIFAILTDAFPANKGAVIGAANACDGAGWAIGPPVGGFLYVAGGFSLPFFVVGPLPLVLLALQLATFPKVGGPSPRVVDEQKQNGSSLYSGDECDDEPDRIGATEVWRRAKALICAPMVVTMVSGAFFTSKWGMFDVSFTPWAVSEFGFSIRTVSIYFSIPAMAFLFISPCGGMVVDKVERKKRLIGAGFALISMVMLSQGPWALGLSSEGRHQLLIPYLVAEGVLSPLIMPAMLPDMLDTTRPSHVAAVDYKVDEHTTNIVTSFFTTSFNLGGIFGPLLGAYLIPTFGSWIHMTGFVEDQLGMGTVLAEATTPPPLPPTAAAERNGLTSGPQVQREDDEQVLVASSDGLQTSEMSMAELENAFGFRSLLAAMALVHLAIAFLLLLFECAALKAAGKYTALNTSEEDDHANDNENKCSSKKRVQEAARP